MWFITDNMAAVQNISCSVCNASYRQQFWHQHLFSNTHKRAVRARGLEDGATFLDGIVFHTTSENTAYDILFAPTIEFVVEDSSAQLADAFATIESFFQHFKAGIKKRIEEALAIHNSVKVNSSLSLLLRKPTIDDTVLQMDKSLRTKTDMILFATDIDDWLKQLVSILLVKYEKMPERGSNWSLDYIVDFELHVSKFIPLSGSSYIPLPPVIDAKKAVINVKNVRDHRCFAYSILTKSLYEAVPKIRNLDRIGHYTEERMREYKFDGIRFPTPFNDIVLFEKMNNVSINVYGVDDEGDKDIYPIRISEMTESRQSFDLLYLINDSDSEANGHYCYITNLSRLICRQKTRHTEKIFICRRCLQHYPSTTKLEEHSKFCVHQPIRSIMPKENSIQQFERR